MRMCFVDPCSRLSVAQQHGLVETHVDDRATTPDHPPYSSQFTLNYATIAPGRYDSSMASRRIFNVQAPLGYRAFLARDRWRQILRFKHPALAGREDEVRGCLESPSLIRESAKESDVPLYYAPSKLVRLCVVTAPASDDERFVVTAYFTKNTKPGKELWRS
jgi:hypothetical protein